MKILLENIKRNISQLFIGCLLFMCFIVFSFYVMETQHFNSIELVNNKFKYTNIKDNKITDVKIIDNINELKHEINKIELVNDKRFELLGWSFSVLCTFIAVVLGINILNSNTTIKDKIKEEIERIDSDRKTKNEIIISDLEKVKSDYQKEIETLKAKQK